MTRRLFRSVPPRPLATAALALALAACGSSGTKAATATPSTPTVAGASSTAAGSGTTAKAAAATGGSAGCSALTKEDLGDFLVDTQLLASINDPEAVTSLKEGRIGHYTPDSFAAILTKLHGALDGHPATGFAEPRDAVAFYEKLNDAVRQMLAANPVTSEMIANYQTLSGGPAGVIGKQLPINAAVGANCKGLA